MSRRDGPRREHVWALVVGVAIAVVVALVAGASDDESRPPSVPERASRGEAVLGATDARREAADGDAAEASTPDPASRERPRLRRSLRAGVERAAALVGSVNAAVLLSGWSRPVAAASESVQAGRTMRMWSTSKVLTAVALLRARGWGDMPGERLGAEVQRALTGALVRSENCRQRRVVLELQEAVGGPDQARAELAGLVDAATARATVSGEVEPPQPICHPFMESQRTVDDPMAPALLLGVSTWTMSDAARFAHALGSGSYGEAVARRVLALMRRPKKPNGEIPPGDYTAAPEWGAGRALAAFDPAYKAGWGGSLLDDFFVTQIAVVELADGRLASLAVSFHPHVQPPKDDPGLTAGPDAVEAVMETVGEDLLRLGGQRREMSK